MILLAKKEQVIPARSSQVFRYVTDMENYGSWFPGVVQVRSGNNLEPHLVGKTYLEKVSFPQGEVDLTIEVTKVKKDKWFETEGDLQPLFPRMTMKFDATQNQHCHFLLAYYSRNPAIGETHSLIQRLRLDLSPRIDKAMENLLKWAEKNQ